MLILSTTFLTSDINHHRNRIVNGIGKCSRSSCVPSSVPLEPKSVPEVDTNVARRRQRDRKSYLRRSLRRSIYSLEEVERSIETSFEQFDAIKITDLLSGLDDEKSGGHKQTEATEIEPLSASNEFVSEIHRQVAQVITRLHESATIDQMRSVIQEFYCSFEDYLGDNSILDSSESINQLIGYIERRLLGPMYNSINIQIASENEDGNGRLSNLISTLNWIKVNDHLELTLNLDNPEIRDLLEMAISQLKQMGSTESPLEKLNCIVNCSQTLINMLKVNSNSHVSADQLLPALISLIIRANPPMLKSDSIFIDSFSYSKHLICGETAYYFTNLCCAIAFIENLDGQSLGPP